MSLLHVGLDVDDNAFHGTGFCKETGETFEFKSKPNLGSLLNKLKNLENKDFELKVCYEATYCGYHLCRNLRNRGIDCEIIAPSLIPEIPGKKVKTDRIDGGKLAKLFANDLLTTIYIPDEEDERVRDLIRSRNFMVNLRKKLKRHILAQCRRYNLNYRLETKGRNHWTVMHLDWMIKIVNKMPKILQTSFRLSLFQLESMNQTINEYDEAIEIISEEEMYKIKKEALVCFRGVSTLNAMTLITELGDIRRFRHPGNLTSYCGLDICEYSSGGKEKKLGITKMGNKHVRTVAIEACQNVSSASPISRRLRKSRENQSLEVIAIADRCMKRLKKKSIKMMHAGKHTNIIKVACAREFLCFIWAALNLVS
jgi:transposase